MSHLNVHLTKKASYRPTGRYLKEGIPCPWNIYDSPDGWVKRRNDCAEWERHEYLQNAGAPLVSHDISRLQGPQALPHGTQTEVGHLFNRQGNA